MIKTQAEIFQKFGIPPSRANIKIKGPLSTTSQVNASLLKAGLTAADLEPIDWRKAGLSPVMNQGQCGDCWAMSTTAAFADKFWIVGNKVNLNPAITAQCASEKINQGCNGGQPTDAANYFEQAGLPSCQEDPKYSDICVNNKCENLPNCNDLLKEFSSCKNIVKAQPQSTTNLSVQINNTQFDIDQTIIHMKTALLKGPIVIGFFVPHDFIISGAGYDWSPTNGIYINGSYGDDIFRRAETDSLIKDYVTSNGLNKNNIADIVIEGGSPAGHAVAIVGWGKETVNGKEIPYWIIRNSWGDKWCKNKYNTVNGEIVGGFCKFAMNTDGKTNNLLGLDIPVTSLTLASTGQTQNFGQPFGGATSFDAVTGLDNPSPPKPPGPDGSKSSKSQSLKIIWIILAVLLGLAIVAFIIYKFFHGKNHRVSRSRRRR